MSDIHNNMPPEYDWLEGSPVLLPSGRVTHPACTCRLVTSNYCQLYSLNFVEATATFFHRQAEFKTAVSHEWARKSRTGRKQNIYLVLIVKSY